MAGLGNRAGAACRQYNVDVCTPQGVSPEQYMMKAKLKHLHMSPLHRTPAAVIVLSLSEMITPITIAIFR